MRSCNDFQINYRSHGGEISEFAMGPNGRYEPMLQFSILASCGDLGRV